MKTLVLFACGVLTGFALARRVNETERGRAFFTVMDREIAAVRASVSDQIRAALAGSSRAANRD